MTYLWEQMHQHDIKLQSSLFWLLTSNYNNNVVIMDATIDKQEEFRGTSSFLTARMVQNSNTVRLYRKCTFASNLNNHATKKMHENLYAVMAPRNMLHLEVYAYQPCPSDVAISDWQRCVRLAFLSGDRNMPIAIIEKPDLMEMPPFKEFCALQP